MKKNITSVCAGLLMGVWVLLSLAIAPAMKKSKFPMSVKLDLTSGAILPAIAVAIVTFIVIRYMWQRPVSFSACSQPEQNRPSWKQEVYHFGVVFAALTVSWSLCFLAFYPGAAMNDTIYSLYSHRNAFQPYLYQLFIYYSFRTLCKITSNNVLAFGIMIYVQLLIFAFVAAYSVIWLEEKLVQRKWIVLITIVYAAVPVYADYSITLVKDTPFAFALLLMLPCLFDFLANDHLSGRTAILLYISEAVCMFSRSNGWLIILTANLILALACVRTKKNVFVIVLTVSLFLGNAGVNSMRKSVNSADYSFRETASIPMSLVSAILHEDGNVSQRELELFNQILPIENWKKGYEFSNVDTLKFNSKFSNNFLNAHKAEFLSCCWSACLRNPKIAIKQLLYHTSGFWNLRFWDTSCVMEGQSVFTRIDNNCLPNHEAFRDVLAYLDAENLKNHSCLPEPVNHILQSFYHDGTLALCNSTGTMVLLLLIMALTFLRHHNSIGAVLISIPIINWMATLAATPFSTIFRYNFYLILMIPFLFGLMKLPNRYYTFAFLNRDSTNIPYVLD